MKRAEFEALGDKMKAFESQTQSKVISGCPFVVRLDGRAFHTFTKGLARPFSSAFSRCMIETTKFLVEETCATVGYTQSDEITLVFMPKEKSEYIFGGKVQKITSVFAAMATFKFNELKKTILPTKADMMALFDARIFSLPTEQEVFNCLLWRETDATRNSLSMAASAYYSQKELNGKGHSEKHEMLYQKGINWNDYPTHFKKGTYVRRTLEMRILSDEERNKIPEEHRPAEDLMFLRSVVKEIKISPLFDYEAQRAILFDAIEYNGSLV